MGIIFYEEQQLFLLETQNTEYWIGIVDEAYLGHIYYGKKIGDPRCAYLLRTGERPLPPSKNRKEKASFADGFPFEYPTWGTGDFRESCLNLRTAKGYRGCELFYESHEIFNGKPKLKGLPATFCSLAAKDKAKKPQDVKTEVQKEQGCQDAETLAGGQTLEITCRDPFLNIKVILRYSVFDDNDAIIRSTEIVNEGAKPIYLEKVLSACLTMEDEQYDYLTLNGSWARERHIQKSPISYGKQGVFSERGISSHQSHPFIAVLDRNADQEHGNVYAMHFVYSGNFLAQVEKDQFDSLRMVMGIHPEGFTWVLEPGMSFTAPEVVCMYSSEGLGKMTRSFHDLYRNHLIRSPYLHEKRPLLINNWEATYFDFDTDKLLAIAREAKKHGIEMLVMDDGWFGRRDHEYCSLGDWVVNKSKLKGGLEYLVEQVKAEGMKFGIWFEPEMVSPDSDLYRLHPEWALQIPGRPATMARGQYVLDLSQQEVVDYVYESVAKILQSADISYVKWDMNRPLTDVASLYTEGKSQGELFHRYVLGLYQMQERLITEFPDLLLENCASGGGRFDPGMLYYSPQIWCSDDTDAIERLEIQEGTALLYPLSTMGAHVSDCPNHIVGRNTPFTTRGHVALAGTFGYELDITKISQEDKKEIEEQTAVYHKYQPLIREGDYYRLASWRKDYGLDCWEVVAKDKSEALVTVVQVLARAAFRSRKIHIKGLDPYADYLLEETGQVAKGSLWMEGGFLVPESNGDFISHLCHFIRQQH